MLVFDAVQTVESAELELVWSDSTESWERNIVAIEEERQHPALTTSYGSSEASAAPSSAARWRAKKQERIQARARARVETLQSMAQGFALVLLLLFARSVVMGAGAGGSASKAPLRTATPTATATGIYAQEARSSRRFQAASNAATVSAIDGRGHAADPTITATAAAAAWPADEKKRS